MDAAIPREKQLTKWNRAWKLWPIESMNRGWKHLFDDVGGGIRSGRRTVHGRNAERAPAAR
jgi:hypothetical protein